MNAAVLLKQIEDEIRFYVDNWNKPPAGCPGYEKSGRVYGYEARITILRWVQSLIAAQLAEDAERCQVSDAYNRGYADGMAQADADVSRVLGQ